MPLWPGRRVAVLGEVVQGRQRILSIRATRHATSTNVSAAGRISWGEWKIAAVVTALTAAYVRAPMHACVAVFVYCMCMCCMCVQLSAAQKQHTIPHRNLNALTQNHKLARYHASNCMSVCVGLSSSRRHVQQRLHDHRLYAKLLCINFRHVCVAPACCKTSERVGCLDIPMQCVFVFVCALNKKRKCKQISSAFSLYYYAFFLVKDPWAQLRCT